MPTRLVAGETFNYRAVVPDYPAGDGWGLTLYFNPRAGGDIVSVTSTADGDNHLLQVAATVTADWAAGSYGWELWASLVGERYRIDAGLLEVSQGLVSATAGLDTRTQAERALDDANAALAAWTPTTRRYRIGDREMEYNGRAEILEIIAHWEAIVRRERNAARIAAGLKSDRKIYGRMGRA